MSIKLFINGILKFLFGLLFLGALVFIPAGTLDFLGGWLLICILFVPMFFVGAFLMIKDPELLKKRLNSKETEKDQKIVIILSTVMFIGAFIIAGLNFRYKWMVIPEYVMYIAGGIEFLSYIIYVEVMKENAYLSRTVEVQEGQQVVDTGLYGIVRHPMYFSTVLLFPTMGLVLGSPQAFLLLLILYIPIIIKRIKNEEKVLLEGLAGYGEYMKKVKYRLFPYIW